MSNSVTGIICLFRNYLVPTNVSILNLENNMKPKLFQIFHNLTFLNRNLIKIHFSNYYLKIFVLGVG